MREKFIYFISASAIIMVIWSAVVAQYDILVSPDIAIRIERPKGYNFIEEDQVNTILKGQLDLQDSSFTIKKVDLSQIERVITTNPYVREVHAFVDISGQLNIEIQQREPIFRVFNSRGVSFYVDPLGSIIPLNPNFTARVPIVTGFDDIDFPGGPTKDTSYTKFYQLVELAKEFQSDPFLQALVEQVYVNNAGEFEMVPKIDSHVIRLGDMKDIKNKILRLKAFYKEALVKFGWDRYELIDVSFKNQIVCRKKI